MRRNCIVGMVSGWAIWGVLFGIGYPYFAGGGILPEFIGIAAAVAAMPVSIGGWLFIWGDGPPQPPWWVNRLPFNVAFGLALYGGIGIWIATRRERRKGLVLPLDTGFNDETKGDTRC